MTQLTQRELLYLEDFLSSEQHNFKTMNYLASQCSDASIRQLCQSCAESHRQNYQTMMKHLQSGSLQ